MTAERAHAPTITPAEAYEDYFGPAIFGPLSEIVVQTSPPHPGDDVLDVACGTGILTRRVAGVTGDDSRTVGVDLNPGMLEVATARSDDLRIEWRQGDGTDLDLPDAAFDTVTCQQGLQFFSDRQTGVREMRRVLRDGGRAVVAVWRGHEHHPLYTALAEAEVPHLAEFGVPVTHEDAIKPFSLGDAEELAALFTDAGFASVSVVQDSILARFPEADRFVERMEYAYAAVVPAFTEDPAAFAAYLEAIDRETRAIVETHRQGDHIVVPMYTNIVVAQS